MVGAHDDHCSRLLLRGYPGEAIGGHGPGVDVAGVRTDQSYYVPFRRFAFAGEHARPQWMLETVLNLTLQAGE